MELTRIHHESVLTHLIEEGRVVGLKIDETSDERHMSFAIDWDADGTLKATWPGHPAFLKIAYVTLTRAEAEAMVAYFAERGVTFGDRTPVRYTMKGEMWPLQIVNQAVTVNIPPAFAVVA